MNVYLKRKRVILRLLDLLDFKVGFVGFQQNQLFFRDVGFVGFPTNQLFFGFVGLLDFQNQETNIFCRLFFKTENALSFEKMVIAIFRTDWRSAVYFHGITAAAETTLISGYLHSSGGSFIRFHFVF